MGAVMSGSELLDGEIVDPDKLDSLAHQIFGAIGREKSIVPGEFLFGKKGRVTRAEENAFVGAELESAELGFSDRADIVAESHEERRTDEFLERNEVDGLAIIEEVSGRVDVSAGMRAEADRRHVGARALGDGLLQSDFDFGVPGVDEGTGSYRYRDVVDPRRMAQEGRLVDSLALSVKRGISASNDAPFCLRKP